MLFFLMSIKFDNGYHHWDTIYFLNFKWSPLQLHLIKLFDNHTNTFSSASCNLFLNPQQSHLSSTSNMYIWPYIETLSAYNGPSPKYSHGIFLQQELLIALLIEAVFLETHTDQFRLIVGLVYIATVAASSCFQGFSHDLKTLFPLLSLTLTLFLSLRPSIIFPKTLRGESDIDILIMAKLTIISYYLLFDKCGSL